MIMDDKNKSKAKKRKGALIAAIVITVLLSIWIISISLLIFTQQLLFETGIFLILLLYILVPLSVIAGIWIALAQRFKEIQKGEAEEASKY